MEKGRILDFAEVVALNAAFGDIDESALRARFEEILEVAQRILSLFVPVTWGALSVHLLRLGIDPQRLQVRGHKL